MKVEIDGDRRERKVASNSGKGGNHLSETVSLLNDHLPFSDQPKCKLVKLVKL